MSIKALVTLVRRSRRLLASLIAIFTLSAVILTACQNQPDTNTVAKYLPDTTQGLVSVALQPSTKQKAEMLLMSQHLPSDVHAKQAMQVRDNLLTDLFKDNHINYATEIKPWLGTEAAIAVLPPQDGSNTPVVVAAVQAKDQQQADNTLRNHHMDTNTYRFYKGYVFMVDADQYKKNNAGKALDAIENVTEGKAKSLQDNTRYSSNIKSLHGEHVVLGWFDIPTLVREGIAAAKDEQKKINDDRQSNDVSFTDPSFNDTGLGNSAALDALSGGPLGSLGALAGVSGDTEDTQKAFNKIQSDADNVGSYSFEIYLTDSSVIFEGATEHVSKDDGNTTDRAILKSLPSDTVGALDIADFGPAMRNMFNSLTSGDKAPLADFDKNNPEVRALLNALGNEAVVVVGNGDPIPYGLVSNVNDQQAATKAMQDVVNALKNDATITPITVSGGTGFELKSPDTTSDFPDTSSQDTTLYFAVANQRIAVSNTLDELNGLLGDNGGLGSTSQIKTAFGDVNKLTFGSLYINLQQAISLTEKQTNNKPDAKTQAWLDALNVLGAQTWAADGHDYSEVRLGLR